MKSRGLLIKEWLSLLVGVLKSWLSRIVMLFYNKIKGSSQKFGKEGDGGKPEHLDLVGEILRDLKCLDEKVEKAVEERDALVVLISRAKFKNKSHELKLAKINSDYKRRLKQKEKLTDECRGLYKEYSDLVKKARGGK